MSQLVCIGQIINVHGVKGAVKIKSYLSNPMDIGTFESVTDQKQKRFFKIKALNQKQGIVLARIQGIETREDAETLKGTSLYIERAQLPKEKADEYYYCDLIGLTVYHGGKVFGKVLSVENFGAGDIINIQLSNGKVFPFDFSNATFPVVSVKDGYMEICCRSGWKECYMKINVLTLYPEMFPGFLGYSLAGKALSEGKFSFNVVNIRDFATDKYKSVDDTPFGGGAGMIMKPDVVDAALKSVYKSGPIYYLSPRGDVFRQQTAHEWAKLNEITFLCGRFEGIDQRILEKWQIKEISVGDFVLSGGEPALLTMLDAVVRLLPSVMGNETSQYDESFENGLLEYPQYTKPQNWEGYQVPEVLVSGHHAKIKEWRLAQSLALTKARRPDLWEKYPDRNKYERKVS